MKKSGYLPRAAFDGVIVPTAGLRVSVVGGGFMFGHGLFETIKVLAGQPVFLEDHVARLGRSAVALGLQFDGKVGRLSSVCSEVIAGNGLADGNLKLIVFQDEAATGEIVLAREGLYPRETYERGFRLTVETVTGRPALAGHKTLSYLENVVAKRRATAKGFDEPLFTDTSGEVFEGATTNLFVVRNGRIATPSPDGRILPGLSRARVLRHLGARAIQAPVFWQQLRDADEVFVTNALLGVMPVAEVDGRQYDLTANAVTRELMRELENLKPGLY